MVEPTRSTPEGDEDTLEGGTPGTLPIDALPAAASLMLFTVGIEAVESQVQG
jgi:hypothetical protein